VDDSGVLLLKSMYELFEEMVVVEEVLKNYAL